MVVTSRASLPPSQPGQGPGAGPRQQALLVHALQLRGQDGVVLCESVAGLGEQANCQAVVPCEVKVGVVPLAVCNRRNLVT